MAFSKRIGSLMSQSLSQNSVNMFYAVRCMSTKLFVGGLSYNTTDHSLREAFAKHGEVIEAKVITDRDSGRSKGFGFVNYAGNDSPSTALISEMDGLEVDGRAVRVSIATEMDGQEVDGRAIRVSIATERPPRGGRGGFNRDFWRKRWILRGHD